MLLGPSVLGKNNGRGGGVNELGPPILGNNDEIVLFIVGIGMWLSVVTKCVATVREGIGPPDDGVSVIAPLV